MKANELPINNFLQAANVQFVIPVYQRNYDWNQNQCKQLINDIISVELDNRTSHFIGSIVFIHEGAYSTSEVKELVIIDGQQRLTTINILYVALYRFAKESGNEVDSNRLYNMFLINQFVSESDYKLKLKQTDNNSKAFSAIINGTEKTYDKFSNVIENYNFFKQQINNENFETILKGLKRLIFVEVSLERGNDDPQRIFESLNSTGLDLSQSDLIRNFILMDLEPQDQHKVFAEIWNPIEENARDLTKQSSMVSDYIRDYLTLRNNKIPNKSKVYAEFKKLYFRKDEVYQKELENIRSLSAHYKKLINPSIEDDNALRAELIYISRLEINVAFPFLLQVLEDEENGIIDRSILLKVLKLIQIYTWRRFIVGLPTNALNKIFMTLYSEVDTSEYYESIAIALMRKKGSGRLPNDEELSTALRDKDLYNIKSKNRNYMFEMLENYQNREFVDTSNENITIEHIFPQNPDKDWNTDLSSEEFFIFKEKLLNTIGNLTLSGNNGALSNKSFSVKKSMNINDAQQGYLYSRLWLNQYLSQIDGWNIETYNTRFEIISKRFLEIWSYPDVELPEIEDATEVNIFDADDPTHKKLMYFIFEDTKIEEDQVMQMYFYVLKKLYKKNAELLLKHNDIIKITRSREDFRVSQELVNGYYFETNIDNLSKFRILKKLLAIFELDDELIIKYSSSSEDTGVKNRFVVRRNFWSQLLPLIENTNLFNNVSASKDHWISAGAGITGVSYNLLITKKYVRIELCIHGPKERNKSYFHKLFVQKDHIESRFGKKLIWEELPDNKMSRIKYELKDVNLFNNSDWQKMNNFIISNLPDFHKAFDIEIKKL